MNIKPIYQKPKFPRLPRELDRRWRLTEEEIAEIVRLREMGWTIAKLSKEYHVATSTIIYWVNEDFRIRQRRKNARYKKTKEEHVRSATECRKYAHKVFPPRKKFDTILSRRNNQLRYRRAKVVV